MRILTTIVAIFVLLIVAGTPRADEVEIVEKARFTVFPSVFSPREVLLVFLSKSTRDFQSDGRAGLQTCKVLLLDSIAESTRETTNEPAAEDEDAQALRRLKLAAAAKAGLNQLNISSPQRRFTRVTALAFDESCSDAMKLFRAQKIDCDGLIMVDPIVDDLPEIKSSDKPRPVDVILHSRSPDEAVRDYNAVHSRLGSWADTARIFTSLGRKDDRPRGVFQTTWNLLRGFVVQPSRHEQLEKPEPDDGVRTENSSDSMFKAIREADVIFAGELHGNPGAHCLQMCLLGFLTDWGKRVAALATEQFERDTQAKVDAFFGADHSKESPENVSALELKFIEESRAWPNYADYRPMLEYCRKYNFPIIAGNVPRRLASRINKEGPEAFEKFSDEDKKWCAKKLNAPDGSYKNKFFEVMGSSTGAKKDDRYAALERMYAAQCLKDDTMAESIVTWLDANKGGKVLHINGAFHSAGGLGIPEKLKALRPDLKIVVITCIEADNPFTAELSAEDAKGNDFVVFVPASRPNRKSEGPVHPK